MPSWIVRGLRRAWRFVSNVDTVVGLLGHLSVPWTSIMCVGASVVVVVGGLLADMSAYIAVPLGGLVGGALGTLIVWLGRKHKVGSQQSEPIPAPKEQPDAWKIPEARTASFKLYEAACLLVGEEPEWPLSTRKSREEYNTLCHAVKTDRLDSNDDSPAFMFGYVLDNDEVHLLELDRKTLRRYLSFQNRPVPDFLLEKFDEHALPPDADKDTGDES